MEAGSISRILREIEDKPDVTVVGGQAIVAWARYFASAPEFSGSDEPVTTRDIDLLGSARRAQELANTTQASISIPDFDDASPNTAVLDLGTTGDSEDRVDFLHFVKGTGDKVASNAVIIEVPDPVDVGKAIRMRVMHPIHCLQSKLANKHQLSRSGVIAQTQLEATTPILREFISEMLKLANGDSRSDEARSAFKTLDRLGEYLERDLTGRHADQLMTRDPLDILKTFRFDERLPSQFREHNIANSVARITAMRGSRQAAKAKGGPKDASDDFSPAATREKGGERGG